MILDAVYFIFLFSKQELKHEKWILFILCNVLLFGLFYYGVPFILLIQIVLYFLFTIYAFDFRDIQYVFLFYVSLFLFSKTILYCVSFPLFFEVMISQVIYYGCTFLMAYWIRKKENKVFQSLYAKKEYSELYHFVHDNLHAYAKINEMIEHEDYTGIKNELNRLSNDAREQFNYLYTGSPLFSLIFEQKREILRLYQISVEIYIQKLRIHSLTLKEQYAFFSYILDQIIQSCLIQDHRFIYIQNKEQNCIEFLFSGSCNEEIKKELDRKGILFSIEEMNTSTKLIMTF